MPSIPGGADRPDLHFGASQGRRGTHNRGADILSDVKYHRASFARPRLRLGHHGYGETDTGVLAGLEKPLYGVPR
jgi:hypothetical protein